MKYKLLYIDDRPQTQELGRLLGDAFAVTTCCTETQLANVISQSAFDYHVALVDYVLEGIFRKNDPDEGISLTRELLSRFPFLVVVGLSEHLPRDTGGGSGSTIKKWLDAGARYYFPKSLITGGEAAAFALERQLILDYAKDAEAIRTTPLTDAESVTLDLLQQQQGLSDILGLVALYAKTPEPIFLVGSSGTGKEVFAHLIHQLRAPQKEFIPENCANLEGELANEKLFGKERDHNNANARGFPKRGLFEAANGGTVFLDQIESLPMPIQAKLLRVIETKKVIRELRAANQPINVVFSLVAGATSSLEQLEQRVAENTFDSGLYNRLRSFAIVLPPLEKRRQDIGVIAKHYCRVYSKQQRTTCSFTEDALTALSERDYPGQVRNLIGDVKKLVLNARAEGMTAIDAAAIAKISDQLWSKPTGHKSAQVGQAVLRATEGQKQRQIENESQYCAEFRTWVGLNFAQVSKNRPCAIRDWEKLIRAWNKQLDDSQYDFVGYRRPSSVPTIKKILRAGCSDVVAAIEAKWSESSESPTGYPSAVPPTPPSAP